MSFNSHNQFQKAQKFGTASQDQDLTNLAKQKTKAEKSKNKAK